MATKRRRLVGKQAAWLRAYLDESNPATFMNATGAARAAGYAARKGAKDPEHALQQMGHENLKKLEPLINEWMDEVGLSEARLKRKLVEGLDAEFHYHATSNGLITDVKSYPDHRVRKGFAELGLKLKGALVDRKELSGPGGGPINIQVGVDKLAAALMAEVFANHKPGLPNLTQTKLDPDAGRELLEAVDAGDQD
jgi:hypothetical protein